MNAPAPIEDQLRATLRRHAGQTTPRADAADVRRRVARRRRRRQVVPAVGAVAVIAAGIVVTSVKDDGSQTSTAADAPSDGAAEVFAPREGGAGPTYVVLPGWQISRYQEIRSAADLSLLAQADVTDGESRSASVMVALPPHGFSVGDGARAVDINGVAGSVGTMVTGVVAVAWPADDGTAVVQGTGLSEDDLLLIARSVSIDESGRVTAVAAAPEGMRVELLSVATGPQTTVDYEFLRGDQRMKLVAYPGGRAVFETRVQGEVRSDVDLFGERASLLDYGTGRYRVDVLIGDYTFEFDSETFASREEFLASVASVEPTAEAPPADVTAAPVDATNGSVTVLPPDPVTADAEPTATTEPAGK